MPRTETPSPPPPLPPLQDPEWDDATRPPLVVDATSTLLSRPIDIGRFGAVYASGGKNVPAGMAVVIVRESWLTSTAVHPMCPQVLDYRKTAGGRMPTPSIFQSLPNTPPIFAAYMLGLVLDDLGARDAFVERIGLKHDGMSNLADEASRKPDGKAAWAYIKTKIADAAKRDSKCGWFTQRLEEVVLAYVWPRIDFNVTKAVNHLIKSPLVAHPKTGRIAVPIPRDDLLTFDPSRVPKLGDPNLAEALASRGCSLVHNISNEPPMVALDFERRLAKASKAKLVRSKRRGTPADGKRPPPSEDVEDAATMIFPMEVDAPTPPRPREVDRLRRSLRGSRAFGWLSLLNGLSDYVEGLAATRCCGRLG